MKSISTLLALSLLVAPITQPLQANDNTNVSWCTQMDIPTAQPSTRTHYWEAFKLYEQAVAFIDQGDKDSAKKKLSEGIDILDDIDSKDAEDYALLTLLYTASCRCYSFPRIIVSMRGSMKNAEKAQELDADNLRVLYALALKDYYTPERHGGFKLVETILNKALALPIPTQLKDGEPAWGRKECYELLVQYLLKKNEDEKAKSLIEKGLKEFPDSRIGSSSR